MFGLETWCQWFCEERSGKDNNRGDCVICIVFECLFVYIGSIWCRIRRFVMGVFRLRFVFIFFVTWNFVIPSVTNTDSLFVECWFVRLYSIIQLERWEYYFQGYTFGMCSVLRMVIPGNLSTFKHNRSILREQFCLQTKILLPHGVWTFFFD